jgi:acetyltransferase-like isoleucine patch superfamily enzyme
MSKPIIGRIGASPIYVGPFTSGFDRVDVRQWGGGAALKVGAFCSIASATVYLDGNHTVDWITTFPFARIFSDHAFFEHIGGLDGFEVTEPSSTNGDVVIGNDVWVGEKVTIMSGVTIGDGAILGTNSHITKDVQPYEIVGGNPAKAIRKRFSDEVVALLLLLHWWDLPIESIRDIKRHLLGQPTVGLLHFLIAKYRI